MQFLGGNVVTFLIVTYIQTNPCIYVHMLFVGDCAHTTDDRHQTIWGKHNATCTTLPHSGSSRMHHVRALGESSLCCGELLLSAPVICHSTIPHISAVCCCCVGVRRSCRTAAVRPPSTSSLQLYARVAAVVVDGCFDRSVPFVTPAQTYS